MNLNSLDVSLDNRLRQHSPLVLILSFHHLPLPALPLVTECLPDILSEKQVPGKDPDQDPNKDPDPLSPADSAFTDVSPNSESCPKTDPSSARAPDQPSTPTASPHPKKGERRAQRGTHPGL